MQLVLLLSRTGEGLQRSVNILETIRSFILKDPINTLLIGGFGYFSSFCVLNIKNASHQRNIFLFFLTQRDFFVCKQDAAVVFADRYARSHPPRVDAKKKKGSFLTNVAKRTDVEAVFEEPF